MIEYTENNPINIILADDHEVVRVGLRRLLSMDKAINIMDEAHNGEDAVKLVEYNSPDIALLDILMPRKDGIEATKEIKSKFKKTLVVMLTAFEDSFHLEKALSAGADGYLAKDIGAKELIESLKLVMRGNRVFSKSIVKLMQKKFIHSEEEPSPAPVTITKREQEVLNLVTMGKTSQEIADKLFISVRTVESHRYNLMQKLHIKNAAGLARYSVMNLDIIRNK